MDYAKLDPGVAMALDEEPDGESGLPVLIRTTRPLDQASQAMMQRLGCADAAPGRTVFTATLSRQAVRALSDQEWVQSVSLSRRRTLK